MFKSGARCTHLVIYILRHKLHGKKVAAKHTPEILVRALGKYKEGASYSALE